MQQLETVKGKTIIVPNIVKRFTILYYDNFGWKIHSNNLCTTPEEAIQSFFNWQTHIANKEYRAEYYKVFEMELEIPFVPKDDI